jgi:hypothetical protein
LKTLRKKIRRKMIKETLWLKIKLKK